MGEEYITGGKLMIADELKVLFDDLKKELLGIKTDLVIIKYDLEQINKRLQVQSKPSGGVPSGYPPGTPPEALIPFGAEWDQT